MGWRVVHGAGRGVPRGEAVMAASERFVRAARGTLLLRAAPVRDDRGWDAAFAGPAQCLRSLASRSAKRNSA